MARWLVLFCLLLVGSFPLRADERIVYQPLSSDAGLTRQQWQEIWRASVRQGAHTLIVQWTAYGAERFGDQAGWLAEALHQAHEQGLQLVLGLYMDAVYYQRLDALDSPGLAAYWQAQLGRSLEQQQRLRADWGLPVIGWYLPMELDDWHFQAPERRQQLQQLLTAFAARLDAPLHVSAFSSGRLAPGVNGNWLGALAGAGIRVWWQDGAGTASLPLLVRNSYAAALPCAVGIIREAFRQVSAAGQSFRAEPAAPGKQPAGCHPTATFELRYRPWGRLLLEQQRMAGVASTREH